MEQYVLPNEKRNEFWQNPEQYLRIDDVGDLHVQWFYDMYAAKRLLKNIPIFERAYELLTTRKNFSRRNAFGEMHGDNYLWIEKHDKIKVMVHEGQSYRYIFIMNGHIFHIRALEYQFNFPPYRKKQLQGITISKFRKQGFKDECLNGKDRFDAFSYGDNRDSGYILSANLQIKNHEKVEYADLRTIYAIKSMEYWVPYLDDTTQLE